MKSEALRRRKADVGQIFKKRKSTSKEDSKRTLLATKLQKIQMLLIIVLALLQKNLENPKNISTTPQQCNLLCHQQVMIKTLLQ